MRTSFKHSAVTFNSINKFNINIDFRPSLFMFEEFFMLKKKFNKDLCHTRFNL